MAVAVAVAIKAVKEPNESGFSELEINRCLPAAGFVSSFDRLVVLCPLLHPHPRPLHILEKYILLSYINSHLVYPFLHLFFVFTPGPLML